MKEKEDILVKGFRRKLEDYSEPVPDGLWEALENDLAPARPRVSSPWRKMFVAAAILGAVMVSVGLWVLDTSVGKYASEAVAVLPAPDVAAVGGSASPDRERLQAFREEPDCAGDPVRRTRGGKKEAEQAGEQEEAAAFVAEASDMPADEPVSEPDGKEGTRRDGQGQPEDTYGSQAYGSGRIVRINRSTKRPLRKDRQRKLAWGVAYANIPGVGNSTVPGFSTLDQSGQMDRTIVLSPGVLQSADAPQKVQPIKEAILGNVGEQVETHVRHKIPVTAGLSFRYGLAGNLAIETGLTYTALSSEIETYAPNGTYVEEYRLHYLGIPLKGNWMFWDSRYITLYLSAGGELEKSVAGKYKKRYMEGGHPSTSYSENVKPVQWSVMGSVGIQFNATEHFGIYAEPGVVHYFDDGSDVLTIRKEKPTNLNLQFGLRWTY